MGADSTSSVESLQAPSLSASICKRRLSGNPSSTPKYSTEVTDELGNTILLGDPNATRALVALMNLHAVIGGAACHWGGPAALAEIMSAVHGLLFNTKNTWYNDFNFVNDAGHTENGVYALRANLGFDGLTFEDLKGFRSIESKLTGHGEAHLNPEGVLVSNGPLGSGLPQAQGLCLADKLLGLDRTTICVISDGASMEGEAKEAFAAIPGLAAKKKLNPFVMVVSDNNKKLSGTIDVDSFSMDPTFQSLPTLGWKTIYVENGHNLQVVFSEIEEAIKEAQANPNQPVAVIVKTIKGYGIKATEESASGGHGFPLKKGDGKIAGFIDEIFDGETPEEFKKWAESLTPKASDSSSPTNSSAPTVKSEKVQAGIAKAMIQATKEGLPVYSISADLQGSTGVAPFHKAFPDRWIEVGVAESNMVNVAAGLSLSGLIPVVDTFAQFGVTKGNLPLTMAALSQAPLVAVFSHTGFQDAADGASHQATTYFAATCSIPQTQVVCCSCSSEAESLMKQALENIDKARQKGETPDSVIFFVGRENYPAYYQENPTYEWGKAQVLKEGSDGVIVASGPMLAKALEAESLLQAKGFSITVINNAFINSSDVETIATAVQKAKGKLITIEDHQLIGGMGAQLSHKLLQKRVSLKLHSIGIPNHFGQSAYTADDLYQMHGMTAEKIVEAFEKL